MTNGGQESGGGARKYMQRIAFKDSLQLPDTFPVTVYTCGPTLRDGCGEDAENQRRHEDLLHHLSPPVHSLSPS
jgi:hypothetical protein